MVQWINYPHAKSIKGGKPAYMRFKNVLVKRRQQHPLKPSAWMQYQDVLDELNTNGFAIVKNAVDKRLLSTIKQHADELYQIPKATACLKEAPKHFLQLRTPIYSVSGVFELAFHDLLSSIASGYFQCVPTVSGGSLRRSFVIPDSEQSTQLYHFDPDSPWFLKFFFYLNDVNMDGGPFVYVKGSHKKKFLGCTQKHRWSQNEIKNIYGEDNIKYLTADFGDMIIANTTGFHKGLKPTKNERTMLTIDYSLHPSKFHPPVAVIKKSDYDNLPEHKKPLADILVKKP